MARLSQCPAQSSRLVNVSVPFCPLFIPTEPYHGPARAGEQCTHFTDEAVALMLMTASATSRGKLEADMLDWTKNCSPRSTKNFARPG